MIELRFSDLIPLYKSVGESVCSCCRSGGRRTGGIQDHSVSLKLFPIFPGQGHVREIASIPQISKDSLFGTNSGVGEKSWGIKDWTLFSLSKYNISEVYLLPLESPCSENNHCHYLLLYALSENINAMQCYIASLPLLVSWNNQCFISEKYQNEGASLSMSVLGHFFLCCADLKLFT